MSSSENFDPGRIRSARERVYGVRIELGAEDPLRTLLGDDWQTVRWYATEAERDAAFTEIQREHRYSRRGDLPTLRYEKIDGTKPNSPVLPRSR